MRYGIIITISVMVSVWRRDDYINTSAWVSRCSFNNIGQCEGLKQWNGQQVRISTLFSL